MEEVTNACLLSKGQVKREKDRIDDLGYTLMLIQRRLDRIEQALESIRLHVAGWE